MIAAAQKFVVIISPVVMDALDFTVDGLSILNCAETLIVSKITVAKCLVAYHVSRDVISARVHVMVHV